MTDPQTDIEARLRQVRDEIDEILDGGSARILEGDGVGELEDIDGVVFGLSGSEQADVRVTQKPVEEPPAPMITILGELLDGLAAASGHPPQDVSNHAIQTMEASKASDQYSRSGSVSQKDPE